jgi:phage tail sheath protein FI
MAETIVSPGVLAIENDQSFITQGPVTAGAAIIGPTVKGKVGIPTICTTYSDYLNKFGAVFLSGSTTYTYFTSISAYNYFNNGGTSLLVTRVVSGTFSPATSSLIPTSTAATSASAVLNLTNAVAVAYTASFNGIDVILSGSSTQDVFNNATSSGVIPSNPTNFYTNTTINSSASFATPNMTVTSTNLNGLVGNLSFYVSGSTTVYYTGGTNTEAFILETISEGEIMNSTGPTGQNNTLLSGSSENYRWQITSPNTSSGTFTLLIRQGNDTSNQPSILESWGPLSLDPFSNNYIEKVIGNQVENVRNDNGEYFVQLSGSYFNQSRYVRVKQVNQTTPEYLDNVGNPKPQYTSSIPTVSEGTFGSAQGKNIPTGVAGAYYENITSPTNIQGIPASNYTESILLLANKDAYRFNLITTPGLFNSLGGVASSAITSINTLCQNRGDSLAIIDLVGYGSNITPVLTQAISYDTSYAATYWPWLQTIDPNTGNQVWVPASTMIPGVYAFNDNVSAPWFAPAGINRGVLSNVLRAERSLTQGNRDLLYENNINAIATFPNTGVVVFGQKTLQKKASALDRVNVRRLLIELKSYISQIADTLVFEQNNVNTRNNFLAQVNPYLSSVQQQQGLTSFRVIMDESNNPPNVVDNNQLIGQIYLQPTRTAEFIILDFNVLPTGATFPA